MYLVLEEKFTTMSLILKELLKVINLQK